MARRMYDENQIKSIASEAGGGKIYRHDVTISRTTSALQIDLTIRASIYSSNSLNIDSLTDLKTVLGNSFNVAATGYYKDATSGNYRVVYAMNQTNVYYFGIDTGTSYKAIIASGSTVTYSDVVTEI